MKNKRKFSNKSIIALSAFLVLTLALSVLLVSNSDLTGYAVFTKGYFEEAQMLNWGPAYFTFATGTAVDTTRKKDDWDLKFWIDTSHDILLVPRLQTTKLAISDRYEVVALRDCEAAFLDKRLTDASRIKFQYVGGSYTSNAICVKLSNSDVHKFGVKSIGRRDVTWEFVGNPTKPTPTPTVPPTKTPTLSPTPSPSPEPLIVSIPVILESSQISQLTGKAAAGLASAPVKKTVNLKLSYDNKVLKFTGLSSRAPAGVFVGSKETSPGKIEIMITYTSPDNLSPGELFKVNFEKLNPKSTTVTLDTAFEDGNKPVQIKRSTSVVKAT